MFISIKINRSEGITLIELLVSLTLTTLILLIAFFIQMSSSKSYLRWESDSKLTDCARLIIKSFSTSVKEGVDVAAAGNSSITLNSSNLRASKYDYAGGGNLLKNNESLVPDGLLMTDFNLLYLVIGNGDSINMKSADELDFNRDFHIDKQELSRIKGVQYDFKLKNNKETKEYKGMALLRGY
jgi:hypothetical protein